MKDQMYHQELGTMTACRKRMTESTKGVGQRKEKGYTKDCFIFDSWFASKRPYEAVTDIGADFIGMVETDIKGFCK